MLKKIYYTMAVAALLTLIISDAEAQWRRLIDRPTFDVWVNELNYNTIFAGGEGRLIYRSYDAGQTWDTLVVGYQGGAAQLNNVMMGKTDTNVVIVGGLLFGDIRRSTDHGETWEIVLQKLRPIATNGKALIRDENNPEILFIGDYQSGVIYKSTNIGKTWDSISTVMRNYRFWNEDGTFRDTLMNVDIGSIGIREDSSNVMFCNTTDGDIHISQDYGVTWAFADSLVRPAIDRTDCEITRLLFSRRDPLTGYCVITYLFGINKPNGGLYKTTDGGYNWDLISFPDTSMWAVAARPYGNQDEVFIGGYTENYFDVDENYVPGAGIVRRSQDGGQSWISYDDKINWTIERPKASAPLLGLDFFDDSTGIAVGHAGNIYLRKPKQLNWEAKSPELVYDYNSVSVAGNKAAFVVGFNGVIMHSSDEGENWIRINTDFNDDLYSVKFFNENTGVIGGKGGLLKRTVDGGQNWVDIETGADDDILDFAFIANIGFACGKNGLLLKSNDSGQSWSTINTGIDEEFKRISFSGSRIIIPLEKGRILISEDDAESWEIRETGFDRDLNAVSFLNDDKVWVAGDNSESLLSSDGGANWNFIEMKSFRHIYDIEMLTESRWVACGQYSTIWLTEDAGANWFYERIGSGPRSNMWSLRYCGDPGNEKLYMASEAGLFVMDEPSDVKQEAGKPEARLNVIITPANTMMVNYKKFDSNFPNDVSFRVVDMNGRLVMSKILPPNTSEEIKAHFRIPELPSGAYICQTIEGDHTASSKIVISR